MAKVSKRVTPVDVHVGNRVRARRMALGLSQDKVAKAIGVTFQQLQKYEKGENRLSASRLHTVADLLGVSPTSFFEGAPGQAKLNGKVPEFAFLSEFVSSAEGRALAKAMLQIKDSRVRRSIVHLVERLAGGE